MLSLLSPTPELAPCLYTSFSILIISLSPVVSRGLLTGFPMAELSHPLQPRATLLPWCLPECALIKSQCLSSSCTAELRPFLALSAIPHSLSAFADLPSLCSVPVVFSPPPLRPFWFAGLAFSICLHSQECVALCRCCLPDSTPQDLPHSP